jgi:hypothetical protein
MAWHLAGPPLGSVLGVTPTRHEVLTPGGHLAGAITTVWPAARTERTIDVLGRGRVFRLEVRPQAATQEVRWLTVLDAAAQPAEVSEVARLSAADGNVEQGATVGVYLRSERKALVALLSASTRPGDVTGPVRYRVPQGGATHVVADLPAQTGYSVSIVLHGADPMVVEVAPGGPLMTSAAGVLAFRVAQTGAVTEAE